MVNCVSIIFDDVITSIKFYIGLANGNDGGDTSKLERLRIEPSSGYKFFVKSEKVWKTT